MQFTLMVVWSLLTISRQAPIQHPAVESGKFNSAGTLLAYTVYGKGTPVVLIHGMAGDQTSLEGLRRALIGNKHQAITFDVRGHGLSGKPHDPRQYGRAMAEDVKRLLDHLAIDRAHVVGYSMGGDIANKFRELYPDRALSVTLGGIGLGVADGWTTDRDFNVLELAASLENGSGFLPLLRLPGAIHEGVASKEELQQVNSHLMKGQDADALAAIIRSLPDLDIDATKLGRNTVPTLVIVGERDAERQFAGRLHSKMTNARLVVLFEMDHFTVVGDPRFTKEIIDFIEDH